MTDNDFINAEWGSGNIKKEWYTRPLKGPKVGEQLIVFTASPYYSPAYIAGIYRFSEELRASILRDMAPPEEVRLLAILMIVLILCICVVTHKVLLRAPSSRRQKRVVGVFVSLLLLFNFSLYVYYESGISGYTDIRMDVLLIWPVLIVNLALLISVMRRLVLNRQDSS